MHWITSAFLAAVGICPVLILTGVAQRNFQMAPEVVAALWMGSVSIGIAAWLVINGRGHELAAISGIWIVIVLFSVTIGVAANILLFQALASAPNAGLALSVFNTNAVITFLATPILVWLLPQYFPHWDFTLQKLGGVVIVFIGLAILSR